MAHADRKQEDEVWYGDGREEELLSYIFHLPHLDKLRNDPDAILFEIDRWSEQHKVLMTIGPRKSARIIPIIDEHQPKVMVELGGYVGYSAIRFGNAVRAAGGTKYISLESCEKFAAVAASLIELAGLADFVEIRVGSAADGLAALGQHNPQTTIDVLFIDHEKSLYLADLKVAENLGLLKPGALIIADNMSDTNTHGFARYIRGGAPNKERGEARQSKYESKTMWFSYPDYYYDVDGVEVARILPEAEC